MLKGIILALPSTVISISYLEPPKVDDMRVA